MVTREQAKKEIAEIVSKNKPIKTGITLPVRSGEKFNVYRIPIDLLVPNQDNDRITWRIREYESDSNRHLDIENEEDVEFLYDLIYDESKSENLNTEKDIAQKGQQVDGVITNNGIIIDGNRRVTLLRKLFKGDADKYSQNVEDFRYFNCIILPEDMQRREIMALETMLQIGVDEKVKYNRICLYIKVDNLRAEHYTFTQIKQYMGLKSEAEVEQMTYIYQLMVDYLNNIGKPNHFTLLDGLEDQFIQTYRVFKLLDNQTYKAEWDYQEGDVLEFKTVCYDYMRSKYEGKKYREKLLGKSKKTDGVFIDEVVWKDFLEKHEEIIDNADPENESDWKLLGSSGGEFDKNLNNASQQLTTVINDKDVSKTINDLKVKISKLEKLLSSVDTIPDGDSKALKASAKKLQELARKY